MFKICFESKINQSVKTHNTKTFFFNYQEKRLFKFMIKILGKSIVDEPSLTFRRVIYLLNNEITIKKVQELNIEVNN